LSGVEIDCKVSTDTPDFGSLIRSSSKLVCSVDSPHLSGRSGG